MDETNDFLLTLRLIPDDVILAMGSRPIHLNDAFQCICGWSARELVERETGVDAESNYDIYVTEYLRQQLGGSNKEWSAINGTALDSPESELLEDAFTDRVLECV